MVRRPLILATVIAALTLIAPSPAQARACQWEHRCTTTYYADSSRTTVVGELFEDCDGTRSFWGTRGASPTFTEQPC